MRVAVIGAGAAGMYTAEWLLQAPHVQVEVDLFERVPTPWGQMRAGVAPDHARTKQIIDDRFKSVLAHSRVRFYGNVEIGRDIRHAELCEWYDAVVYAVGAGADIRLGISGEDLAGCCSAREFVGWYNGHPDYSDLQFDLSCERAVVVGSGYVALDVARILMRPVESLAGTDIADYALEALRRSSVREVVVLGRRGHLQGAFDNADFEELLQLPDVDIVVDSADLPPAGEVVLDNADWSTRRKLVALRRVAARMPTNADRRIVLRLLTSPVEILGNDRMEQVLVVRNHLEHGVDGQLKVRPSEEESLLDAGLLLRAIGYRCFPFPGLPFDESAGVIDNDAGRVTGETGVYVTGWSKRGARGVITTNEACARQTVDCLLADRARGVLSMATLKAGQVETWLNDRTIDWVSYQDWLHIDELERRAGQAQGRPRVKLTRRYDLLHCLTEK